MSPLRLLCVEDDPDIRYIVGVALGLDPAITLETAVSAEAALAMLADRGLPDAVLLDVMLPGADGPALLARLRTAARTRALPVIFITAKARPGDVAEYLARGALGVIVKPFDPLTLAAQIRALLRAA